MDSQPSIRGYRETQGVRLDDLAARLGVNKSTLWRWEEGQVPAERVLEVERVTGVSRHALRPDVFGPQPSEAAE
jgi:DNA-binding transcriptional regulator YdaS (Cro superfamily)